MAGQTPISPIINLFFSADGTAQNVLAQLLEEGSKGWGGWGSGTIIITRPNSYLLGSHYQRVLLYIRNEEPIPRTCIHRLGQPEKMRHTAAVLEHCKPAENKEVRGRETGYRVRAVRLYLVLAAKESLLLILLNYAAPWGTTRRAPPQGAGATPPAISEQYEVGGTCVL